MTRYHGTLENRKKSIQFRSWSNNFFIHSYSVHYFLLIYMNVKQLFLQQIPAVQNIFLPNQHFLTFDFLIESQSHIDSQDRKKQKLLNVTWLEMKSIHWELQKPVETKFGNLKNTLIKKLYALTDEKNQQYHQGWHKDIISYQIHPSSIELQKPVETISNNFKNTPIKKKTTS